MVTERNKKSKKTNKNNDLENVITKDKGATYYKRSRLFSGKRKSREELYKE